MSKMILALSIMLFLFIGQTISFASVKSDKLLSYDRESVRISIDKEKIKNYEAPAREKLYVFENSYGIFAVLDFPGQLYKRERIIPDNNVFKKITLSQFDKQTIRLSLKLQKKDDFFVSYSGNQLLISNYFQEESTAEDAAEEEIVIESDIEPVLEFSEVFESANQEIVYDMSVFNDFPWEEESIKEDEKETTIGEIFLQVENEATSSIELPGEKFVHVNYLKEMKKKNNFSLLEMQKADNYDLLSYKLNGVISWHENEDELDFYVKNAYTDFELGGFDCRFGWTTESAKGISLALLSGFEAFYPKRLYDYVFPEIERQRIAVPEFTFEKITENFTFGATWQIRHEEHELDLFADGNESIGIVIDEAEYSFIKDSDYSAFFSSRFKGLNFNLGYRYGYDLFPVFEQKISDDGTIKIEQRKQRFHSVMAGISGQINDDLLASFEFVYNRDKPMTDIAKGIEKKNEVDMVLGLDYSGFKKLDIKTQLLSNKKQGKKREVGASLWLKPKIFDTIDTEIIVIHNFESSETIIQPKVKKSFLEGRLLAGARYDHVENPNDQIGIATNRGFFAFIKYIFSI